MIYFLIYCIIGLISGYLYARFVSDKTADSLSVGFEFLAFVVMWPFPAIVFSAICIFTYTGDFIKKYFP